MKIRRIKVLLAKGWYVAVWCVSYSLFSMICSFASAREPAVTAVVAQDVIKAGDIISGRVSDNGGPMMLVNVTERDSLNRIVAHSVTDVEGKFSFRLVNPADRLEVTYVGYQTVDTVINSTYYEIKLIENKDFPPVIVVSERIVEASMYGPWPPIKQTKTKELPAISMDEFDGVDVAFSSGKHLIINKPLLVLDGNIITPDSTAWAGFDITKTEYSKDELSRLFGIKARKIKTVTVLKGEAATAVWGMKGWAGVIDVQTKKGYRKMKKTQL
ncbi:MAG: hypothetical protein J5705_00460 [Bacteroidaceae bacterium]|nr:hypothetical protein [Bacteroidaceae bacterium]